MKFYCSKEFKRLEAEWQERLKKEGFNDQEDHRRNLIYKNTRTLAWQNQIEIREFFLLLDHFMFHYQEMPEFHRKVMSLYSEGVPLTEIASRTGASTIHCRKTVATYKAIVLAIKKIRQP